MRIKMLRPIALLLYGFGVLLSIWLIAIAFVANNHLELRESLSFAVMFLPMFFLMIGVFSCQFRSSRIVWLLVPIVLVSASSLLALVANHFPARTMVLVIIHGVIVASSLVWIVFFSPGSEKR